ncbi:MAG: bifunctional phosphopantothenoylcysteine decarboxylase/phosphopantothenate--cysteine ligase CoaBC [Gammaproteobacteria bacterium]|nr:bifunctional phosphopantothenoylcysteine decarboxylase/phosphopantothenate--cysteine ligase CoaBC [Gammaproteobacteria bacterium]MBU1723212.1 bifunctional phosphopantothenoylcysteine decarboxylase/phosphopantothenate--cysteine ligase CoaBC [Gammaproteobacteria bacterium]MBU2007237.1 bifunctional phosphopantothenoylcysteine decarboxylase/phosphopantothenate--cysteine ligase CoaBC [Gammaproteobacteria bacterium]
MSFLPGKNILLGISGGIAAYKSAELVRLLRKQGANVRVCMTASARQFITPLTMQALSGNPVHTELLDPAAEAGMGHIELARWADYILIAPATANTLAKLTWGLADDLLGTVCLASKARLAVAPAMNQQMWKNPATQHNIRTLVERGVNVFGPAEGEQACGDTGPGRMLEPAELLRKLEECCATSTLLQGKRVLITAGPTREPLDPVRFLTNRSSGKMGYAVALAAAKMGAEVMLVSGHVALECPPGVNRVITESAADMLVATQEYARQADLFVATAAVADYTPVDVADRKIKKNSATFHLEMKRTTDILATIKQTHPQLFTVGFAAETHDLMTYARGKLERKGIDMIAANSVANGKAFDQPTNALEVVWLDGHRSFPEMDKQRLAEELMKLVVVQYNKRKQANDKH